ncbi:hypothetical protein EGW08_017660 [Elysia chlorotica]|uniref:Uncharacterized protein n=1 Tax=Elysia chlorotica TaxID=188477 RepID=A0A3S0ZGW3_ELYCH|nr:hypothetical protein EGW08_017660 [Elysia chlorotica]
MNKAHLTKSKASDNKTLKLKNYVKKQKSEYMCITITARPFGKSLSLLIFLTFTILYFMRTTDLFPLMHFVNNLHKPLTKFLTDYFLKNIISVILYLDTLH